jgi:hypothetical protein
VQNFSLLNILVGAIKPSKLGAFANSKVNNGAWQRWSPATTMLHRESEGRIRAQISRIKREGDAHERVLNQLVKRTFF